MTDYVLAKESIGRCNGCARDFVLSLGRPIPVVTLPDDDWLVGPLANKGCSFRIVFHSPDLSARRAAVRSGIGLTAMPSSFVPADLVETKEYYLPRLPPIKALLCTRIGIEPESVEDLLQLLEQLSQESLGSGG